MDSRKSRQTPFLHALHTVPLATPSPRPARRLAGSRQSRASRAPARRHRARPSAVDRPPRRSRPPASAHRSASDGRRRRRACAGRRCPDDEPKDHRGRGHAQGDVRVGAQLAPGIAAGDGLVPTGRQRRPGRGDERGRGGGDDGLTGGVGRRTTGGVRARSAGLRRAHAGRQRAAESLAEPGSRRAQPGSGVDSPTTHGSSRHARHVLGSPLQLEATGVAGALSMAQTFGRAARGVLRSLMGTDVEGETVTAGAVSSRSKVCVAGGAIPRSTSAHRHRPPVSHKPQDTSAPELVRDGD